MLQNDIYTLSPYMLIVVPRPVSSLTEFIFRNGARSCEVHENLSSNTIMNKCKPSMTGYASRKAVYYKMRNFSSFHPNYLRSKSFLRSYFNVMYKRRKGNSNLVLERTTVVHLYCFARYPYSLL